VWSIAMQTYAYIDPEIHIDAHKMDIIIMFMRTHRVTIKDQL